MTDTHKMNVYKGREKLRIKEKIDTVLSDLYKEVDKMNQKEDFNLFQEIDQANKRKEIELNTVDAMAFVEALNNPPKANSRLKDLMNSNTNLPLTRETCRKGAGGIILGDSSTVIEQNKLNPKDQMASTKLPVNLVPTELIRETARAREYGAFKAPRKDGKFGYGAWNWREAGVSYTTMVAAIIRHALELMDGEDIAEDSKVSHLGHIAAGVGIILDAKKNECLKDDRPKSRSNSE